ncbi:MAG: hypothetical protein AAGG48_25815 [Planctomycetota bacterium]
MNKKPTFALVILLCFGCDTAPNQSQNQVSPSETYVLSVPQKYQSKTKESVWMVTIKSADGSVLYRDEDSTMWSGSNAYFGWDEQDRVWLYYSDDQRIWRWELVNDRWTKQESSSEDGIPNWILPDYAK